MSSSSLFYLRNLGLKGGAGLAFSLTQGNVVQSARSISTRFKNSKGISETARMIRCWLAEVVKTVVSVYPIVRRGHSARLELPTSLSIHHPEVQ